MAKLKIHNEIRIKDKRFLDKMMEFGFDGSWALVTLNQNDGVDIRTESGFLSLNPNGDNTDTGEFSGLPDNGMYDSSLLYDSNFRFAFVNNLHKDLSMMESDGWGFRILPGEFEVKDKMCRNLVEYLNQIGFDFVSVQQSQDPKYLKSIESDGHFITIDGNF